MTNGVKVLLVEDDPSLGFVVKDNLEIQGYAVTLAKDGLEGWNLICENDFQFCLFDIMLPKLDGLSLLKKVRAKDLRTPIFMITAKSLLSDKLEGLSLGADDYLIKPFSIEELLLRMKIVLTRLELLENSGVASVFYFEKCTFYPHELKIEFLDHTYQLTQRESELLMLLCSHANSVVKREQILEQLWGSNDYFMGRSLDVFISRLRKILSFEPNTTISNVHGVGFKLISPQLSAKSKNE